MRMNNNDDGVVMVNAKNIQIDTVWQAIEAKKNILVNIQMNLNRRRSIDIFELRSKFVDPRAASSEQLFVNKEAEEEDANAHEYKT